MFTYQLQSFHLEKLFQIIDIVTYQVLRTISQKTIRNRLIPTASVLVGKQSYHDKKYCPSISECIPVYN